MRRILTLAIGIVVSIALALPAGAATTSFTDVRGDANALNEQGVFAEPLGTPQDNDTDPASYSALDIVKGSLGTKYKTVRGRKVATAVVATLVLADRPAGNAAVYRITGDAAQGNDCTTFLLSHVVYADGSTQGTLRTCDPDDPTGQLFLSTNVSTKVSGTKITWTMPLGTLSRLGLRSGTRVADLGAHTRLNTSPSEAVCGSLPRCGATVPQIDQVQTTKSYAIGK